ncbi:MAG: metallophosphoesterase [Deltaproteobacteria bacterium]
MRKASFTVLALLVLCNFLIAWVTFGSQIFPPDSFAQKLTAVTFFTYLGCVLLLCLFFSVLGTASITLDLKDTVVRLMGGRTAKSRSARARQDAPDNAAGSVTSLRGEYGLVPEPAGLGTGVAPLATESQVRWDAMSPAVGARDFVMDRSRRSFLKWGAAAGVTTAFVLAGRGVSQAYGLPVIEEFNVFNSALDGLDGRFTVIQVSDFHFGMFFGTAELEEVVDRLNAIEGDALFITGDTFHSPLSAVEQASPILRRLRKRRFGNFAVLGNHDFYAGEKRSVRGIQEGGLTLLRDRWVTFERGSAKLHVAGMDDPMGNWVWGKDFPNFRRIVNQAPDGNGMRVLLSHRPNILPLASHTGINFVLAGHIHGGQIILPMPGTSRGVSVARLASFYTHGWYRKGTASMYLNRGVGLTFVPWRINCPPEITVFHLMPPAPGRRSRAERVVRKCRA